MKSHGHCHQVHCTCPSHPHSQEQSTKGFAIPKIHWKNPQILGPSYLHLLEQSTYGICYLKTIWRYWVFPPLSLLGLEHGFSRSQDQFTILLGHLISNNHYLTPSSFAPTTTTTIWVTLDFSVNPVMSLVPWYDSIPFYFCILVFPPWCWLTMMHSTNVTPHMSHVSLCDCLHSMLDFSLSPYCLWHLYLVMPRRWTNDH